MDNSSYVDIERGLRLEISRHNHITLSSQLLGVGSIWPQMNVEKSVYALSVLTKVSKSCSGIVSRLYSGTLTCQQRIDECTHKRSTPASQVCIRVLGAFVGISARPSTAKPLSGCPAQESYRTVQPVMDNITDDQCRVPKRALD